MNNIFRLIMLSGVLCLTACSDYQAGFADGYGGTDRQRWIVFGKAEYQQGFFAGEADRFQQDWMAANPLDADRPICRAPEITAEADMFTPAGYRHVAEGVFSLVK